MDSFKTVLISIVPIIYKIGVPFGPERVDGTDNFVFSKSHHQDPILASIQNNDQSSKTIRVHMEWTDGASTSD